MSSNKWLNYTAHTHTRQSFKEIVHHTTQRGLHLDRPSLSFSMLHVLGSLGTRLDYFMHIIFKQGQIAR